MTRTSEASMRYLIADPDPGRRSRIVARLPAGAALEAASLTEAFHVSEAHRPDAIALSADITGDMGLDMFLHLVDALSIALLVYGDRADRTPPKGFGSPFRSFRMAATTIPKGCLTSS
jgi:hypothetical protein